jgi:hypothetical protein
VNRTARGRVAINARMLSPADIAGIRIHTFDGADMWKYIDNPASGRVFRNAAY